MRTTQRDQGGTSTFSASFTDAPSGSGIAQPGGVPFTFIRAQTGVYDIRFDTALSMVNVTASPNALTVNGVTVQLNPPGSFRVYTLLNNVATNGGAFWTCTALDKRR